MIKKPPYWQESRQNKIKVLLKNSSKMTHYSIDAIEKMMGLRWLNALEFQTDLIIEKVLSRSQKALKKKELSIREKWLGVRYQSEISSGFSPDVSIRWIDEDFCYGVFAESPIAPRTYVGEYTGLVRKRIRRVDRKNDYCFEYMIGDWLLNPYVIDAKGQGNFTRFINHSEEPNIETLSVYANEVMHIIFIALKPIKKGTQLCYHYGDYFWKKRPKSKNLLIN